MECAHTLESEDPTGHSDPDPHRHSNGTYRQGVAEGVRPGGQSPREWSHYDHKVQIIHDGGVSRHAGGICNHTFVVIFRRIISI
jgi:hypothetical protein